MSLILDAVAVLIY